MMLLAGRRILNLARLITAMRAVHITEQAMLAPATIVERGIVQRNNHRIDRSQHITVIFGMPLQLTIRNTLGVISLATSPTHARRDKEADPPEARHLQYSKYPPHLSLELKLEELSVVFHLVRSFAPKNDQNKKRIHPGSRTITKCVNQRNQLRIWRQNIVLKNKSKKRKDFGHHASRWHKTCARPVTNSQCENLAVKVVSHVAQIYAAKETINNRAFLV
eukprot:GEMP01090275.1.p1 GENE.GEMP01090275.1~~GEMP01090275.1.p1  ORF type:complete len:220 (+),score=-0.53 GEMP01090275.1:111-770(+)